MKREIRHINIGQGWTRALLDTFEDCAWVYQGMVEKYYVFTRDLPEEPEAQEPVLATEVIQLQNSIAHGAAEEPETCPKCAAWESLYDQCRSLPAPGNALSKDVLVLEGRLTWGIVESAFWFVEPDLNQQLRDSMQRGQRVRLTIEKLSEEPVGPQFAEILPAKKRPDLVIDDSAERTGRVR